ncbi:MAG: hypothetical protein V4544_02500 [Pseudomonadota bacterium]
MKKTNKALICAFSLSLLSSVAFSSDMQDDGRMDVDSAVSQSHATIARTNIVSEDSLAQKGAVSGKSGEDIITEAVTASGNNWYSPPGMDMIFALFHGILEMNPTPENERKARIIEGVFGKNREHFSQEALAADPFTQSMRVAVTSDSFLESPESFTSKYAGAFKQRYNTELTFTATSAMEDKIVIEHIFDLNKNWQHRAKEDMIRFIPANGLPRNVNAFEFKRLKMNYCFKDGVNLLSIPFVGDRYAALFRYNSTDKNDVNFPTNSDFETLYEPSNGKYKAKFTELMGSVMIPFSSMKANKVDFIPILANTPLSATYQNQFDPLFFNKRSILEVKISQEIKKAQFNHIGASICVKSRASFVQADSMGSGKSLYVQGPYSLAVADLYTGKLCFMQKITDFDSLVEIEEGYDSDY